MGWSSTGSSICVLWLAVFRLEIEAFGLDDLLLPLSETNHLYSRAVNVTTPIEDGQVLIDQLSWGEAAYWAYIPANKTSDTVYITLNVCTQPLPLSTLPNSTISQLWNNTRYIPALRLYGSNDSSNTLPNATQATDMSMFEYGFANLTYQETSGNLYVSVSAPPKDPSWNDDVFSYQIGLSTSAPLHRALAGDQNRFLFLQDSDFSAALLTTGNLTSSEIPNYQIWINPSIPSSSNGYGAALQNSLQWSWCGVTQSSALVTLSEADRSMTLRGPGGLPKEQFYVHDLVPSTFYDAYITLQNNYTQGGTIWPVQTFKTRDDTTCQVIYNMEFCYEVAYSVPSNSTLYNPVALGQFYDNLAQSYYNNFSISTQQLNCNGSADGVYSLIVNCTTCLEAYKDWVCAATIPRCADVTNPASYLVYRNVSRNPAIDQALHPGPYKEVLPCGDLVQSMTRKCPIALGLRQPHGSAMFDAAYGQRSNNATITCNAPGVDFWVAGSITIRLSIWLLASAIVFSSFSLL